MAGMAARGRCGKGATKPAWWIRGATSWPAVATSSSTRFAHGWWPNRGEHPWSSYRANAEGLLDSLLTPHPEYLALGAEPTLRALTYRASFADALPDELVRDIRSYLQQQKALGTDRFRAWVEARTGRFATVRPIGRPPRHSNCP